MWTQCKRHKTNWLDIIVSESILYFKCFFLIWQVYVHNGFWKQKLDEYRSVFNWHSVVVVVVVVSTVSNHIPIVTVFCTLNTIASISLDNTNSRRWWSFGVVVGHLHGTNTENIQMAQLLIAGSLVCLCVRMLNVFAGRRLPSTWHVSNASETNPNTIQCSVKMKTPTQLFELILN